MANLDVYLKNRAARLEAEAAASRQALAEAQAQLEAMRAEMDELTKSVEAAGYSVEKIEGEIVLLSTEDRQE